MEDQISLVFLDSGSSKKSKILRQLQNQEEEEDTEVEPNY